MVTTVVRSRYLRGICIRRSCTVRIPNFSSTADFLGPIPLTYWTGVENGSGEGPKECMSDQRYVARRGVSR